MSTLPTAVFVLGIRSDSRFFGCTISSVVSLDIEKNQKVLFTLSDKSRFGDLIDYEKPISVNLLNANQVPEAIHFSKFSNNLVLDTSFTWRTEQNAIFLEGCETFLNCKLSRKIYTESNAIFILNVISLKLSEKQRPLIYLNRAFNPVI